MEYLYLSYYTKDSNYCGQEELEFFTYLQVIKDDFKKISLLVSYCEYSKEKESLLFNLNKVIKNIARNKFIDDLEMDLDIRIVDNYLIFSYYSLDDECVPLNETPHIVIVSRDMKNIYFIDETYSVFREEEQDDTYNRGHDEITYYKLDNGIVKEYNCYFEEYTCNLFGKFFGHPNLMIKQIEDEIEDEIKKNVKLWLILM